MGRIDMETLKLDLGSHIMKLQINDWHKANSKAYEDEWCRVKCQIKSDFMDYRVENNQPDCETLMWSEVESLLHCIEQLLSGKTTEKECMSCVEPDFEFVFYPATENVDSVGMDILIAFWERDGALSANSLQLYLGQEEVEAFYEYLKLVCEEIDSCSPKLEEMRKQDILINEE